MCSSSSRSSGTPGKSMADTHRKLDVGHIGALLVRADEEGCDTCDRVHDTDMGHTIELADYAILSVRLEDDLTCLQWCCKQHFPGWQGMQAIQKIYQLIKADEFVERTILNQILGIISEFRDQTEEEDG